MSHTCHAEGCPREVPPRLLMCPAHWRLLPARLKAAVLRAYRPGQEVDKQPSVQYLVAQRKACMWVAIREGRVALKTGVVEVLRWMPEVRALSNTQTVGPLTVAELDVLARGISESNRELHDLTAGVVAELQGAAL